MVGVLDSAISPIVTHHSSASNESWGRTIATAWHYGDPLVEQSRLDRKAGIVDRWDRVALRISGPERLEWLNNLISQKVNAMVAGQASYGLILDGQGRVQHFFGISCVEDSIILDVPSAEIDELESYLQKMVFWSQVSIERMDWARLTVVSHGLFAEASAFHLSDATSTSALPSDLAVQIPADITVHLWRSHLLGDLHAVDVWVDRDKVTEAWDAFTRELSPTGMMAYDAARMMARIPDLSVDVDEKVIPHEVAFFIGEGLEQGATQLGAASDGPTSAAVHLNKGCYRGQETVSRVHNLGKSPRVLVLLQLDGSANRLPEVGAEVTAGGRPIGRVGSSVHDADYGPIALALVKRSVVERIFKDPAAVPPISVDGVDASVDQEDVDAVGSANGVRPGRAAINRLKGRP